MLCPSCSSENGDTRKFCRACGAPFWPVCQSCGTTNEPGDRFCGECGAQLTPVAVQAPPASQPTSASTAPAQSISYLDNEERRPVTVLFADIVGFTSLSERLDAESVREITTECFRRLVPVVARYEGTVDKFIGDAIMVLFGAPIAHEDDPARAVRSALAMLEALSQFNQELQREQGFTLALRIGIESGEVVAGLRDVVGVREYTVIGDAVNTAARLQAAAEPDSILVGPRAHQAIRSLFSFREVPPLALKGKDEPVPAWVVEGHQPTPASRAIPEPRAPLVGRARELAALEHCLDELQRGRGQIALVIGDPGLGKSRLLREAREQHPTIHWRRCQAFAHEGDVSYGLARAAVRDLFDLDTHTDDETTSVRLRDRLEALHCLPAFPALISLLGASTPGQDTPALDQLGAQELQQEIFRAISTVIERLAAERPLVFELDDLQWADPTSIDLLLAILALTERVPVFFCLAFRPERDSPAWTVRERCARDFPHRYTEVSLQPLDAAASHELAATLLGTTQLPPALSTVLDRAAGTPLWLEELTQTLVERGLLSKSNGQWRLTDDLDHVEIPSTLQALIVARIDRLGEARTTLQTASVIGREFQERVLASVSDDPRGLDEHLKQAQRVDLLRELAAIPEREYEFKHVLMQEAAYATLLTRRRRELHRRVAEALAELYQDHLGELHSVIANHYLNAEAWEEAVRHARLAAEIARETYANREARQHLRVAIAAADQLPAPPADRQSLFEARAEVNTVLGDFEGAREDYEAALAIADELGNHRDRARLLGALGLLWGGHKNYEQGVHFLEEAIKAARASGDRGETARATAGFGIMLLNQGEMEQSLAALEDALGTYRDLSDQEGIARTLDVIGMVSMMSGDVERAIPSSAEAMERLRDIGDRWTEASSAAVHGVAHSIRGDLAGGQRWTRYAIELWEQMDAATGVAFGNLTLGQVCLSFGRYQTAYDALQRTLSIARELDHREWKAGSLGWLSRVWRACGDADTAMALGHEMLETAEQLGAKIWIALALGELGHGALERGDVAEAIDYFDRASALGRETHLATVDSHLGRAEALLLQGNPQAALAAAIRFLDVATSYRVLEPDARRIAALALRELGDVSAAEKQLREAVSRASTIDTLPPLWRAARALGDLLMASGKPDEARHSYAAAGVAIRRVADDLSDLRLRSSFAALHASPLMGDVARGESEK